MSRPSPHGELGLEPERPSAVVGSVREAVSAAVDALAAAGCDTPRLDAELLVAAGLGVDRAALVSDPGRSVPAAAARWIGQAVRRRVAREPVAYIVGRRGFRHIELEVDRRVLIPRPETELLVELALELPVGARVHEVGTGSGAVALALRDERPDLELSASDASPAALAVARANSARLGLDLELSLARGLAATPDARRLDLVIANLPYVAVGEMASLEPEIRLYEPREALLAGAEGLDAIAELVAQAPSGVCLALEHAPHQAAAVRALLDRAETRRDLAGLERVTAGRVR